jgi:hypothetical protein
MELILQLLHVSWLDPAMDAIIYFLESHSTGVPGTRGGGGDTVEDGGEKGEGGEDGHEV